jgi:PadR family transcriptional regulator, regulatory protein AphA
MTLENAILGFLEREPMTGYDLKTRCFDEAAGHVWTADQAQVYRTLERLSDRGLVRSRVLPQRGRPDRRIYRITPKGRDALVAWLRQPQAAAPVRDPLLVRVFMAGDLTDTEIADLLTRARDDYQARLEALRADAAADTPSCAGTDARGAALYRMTLAAAMSATRAVIDWIDDCTDRISRGLPPASPQATGEGV